MDGNGLTGEGYRFGEFRLLPRLGRLLRGDKIVPLARRAIRLVIVLVENHHRIVTRDELFAEVWAGVTVGEDSLWKQIKILRQELGSDAIETVPGMGYRFGFAVERIGVTTREPPALVYEMPQAETRTNLPERPPLIGRAAELGELQDDLARHRLVTLVGPGGVGETRLAIETGRQLVELISHGVWLIDLAPLTDSAQVASTTAMVLGTALPGADRGGFCFSCGPQRPER
jgi:DNA-binding winged helix-turn-helix (wHTH) protein